MFETKKDSNETEMRTLIELLYGSVAIKEQALSCKIFLWGVQSITKLSTHLMIWFSLVLFPSPLCNVTLMKSNNISPPAAVSTQDYNTQTPNKGGHLHGSLQQSDL